MAVYFVAALSRYALVEAEHEHEAIELGTELLLQMYDDLRAQANCNVPLHISTVRRTTNAESQLWYRYQASLN
jgi:hypothetical protein